MSKYRDVLRDPYQDQMQAVWGCRIGRIRLKATWIENLIGRTWKKWGTP